MRYYCKKQDVTIEVNKDLAEFEHLGACHCCSNMVKIPAYETVAQWEARTGRNYPDTAPVWLIQKNNAEDRYALWRYGAVKNLLAVDADFLAIAAASAGAPPDDWRPE